MVGTVNRAENEVSRKINELREEIQQLRATLVAYAAVVERLSSGISAPKDVGASGFHCN